MINKIIFEDCKNMYNESLVPWERLNKKTVLITGAYGMLASYMVWMLIYLNEYIENFEVNIIALCRHKEKAEKCFHEYCNKQYFHLLINDVSKLFTLDSNIDFIIHAASYASSQYYSVNPVGVITPNVLGTYNTLEMARKKFCEGYLYFSSGEIYGRIEKELISEDDCGYLNSMDIRSCYGESKRLGEILCKSYNHQFGLKTTVVRPSHTYGPTMDLDNDQRVFSEFTKNILEGKNISIKSDGTATRCFCYIYDATLAYFKILLDGKGGEAYNVANEQGSITIKELANTLIQLFPEKKLNFYYQTRTGNYMENTYKKQSVLCTKKLEQLGWIPKYNIKDGFKRTIVSFNEEYHEKN